MANMKLFPSSLVGRNALFVTIILILNQILWLMFVRPLVFDRYVAGPEVYHPVGPLRLWVDLEWAVFALVSSTVGAYVLFYWLRRQLKSVMDAARLLGSGEAPPRLPESGPEEIRELSRGFNQLAANLESLEADRRVMLVGISHDLSTPLTRMRLGLELVQMKSDLSQVGGLIQDVEEMGAILSQFNDYARGKEEGLESADFNQLVAEVCARYQTAGESIQTDLAPLPALTCRPLALRRLVTNLIDNAARYAAHDVTVRTRRENEKVIFSVEDRGPGIQSTDPAALVTPFAREDSARGGPRGAGLGLSLVNRIAKMHGGELQLSNREGGGLAAVVTLAC
jgi:two-component system osmolarity sensor histidine kinase EnvZ